MRKFLLSLALLASAAFAQISNPIRVVYVGTAPTVGGACSVNAAMQRSTQSGATNGHLYSCQSSLWVDITGAGGASGTVTSVVIAGTANQISVAGTCTITTTGTCTLSIPTNPTLPGNTTGTFIGNLTGTASALADAGLVTALTTFHANDTVAYCTGGNYTLTATAAAVDCPTTDPAITIAAAGTYLIWGSICYEHVGATYSANRTLTGAINRTNNTPATLTNSGLSYQTGIITTITNTAGCNSTILLYTTANTNDAISLFGSVSVLPDAGTSIIARAKLSAVRLY